MWVSFFKYMYLSFSQTEARLLIGRWCLRSGGRKYRSLTTKRSYKTLIRSCMYDKNLFNNSKIFDNHYLLFNRQFWLSPNKIHGIAFILHVTLDNNLKCLQEKNCHFIFYLFVIFFTKWICFWYNMLQVWRITTPKWLYTMNFQRSTFLCDVSNYIDWINMNLWIRRCNAKFLWKRIPSGVKMGDYELQNMWRVGQCMWRRDWPGVHEALNFEWSNYVAERMNALKGTLFHISAFSIDHHMQIHKFIIYFCF